MNGGGGGRTNGCHRRTLPAPHTMWHGIRQVTRLQDTRRWSEATEPLTLCSRATIGSQAPPGGRGLDRPRLVSSLHDPLGNHRLVVEPAGSPPNATRPEWAGKEWANEPRDRKSARAGGVQQEPYPLSDIRGAKLSDSPQPAPMLTRHGYLATATTRLPGGRARRRTQGGLTTSMRQPEMTQLVSAVKQAFAGGSWQNAHGTAAWATRRPHGRLIRAYGGGFKAENRRSDCNP